MFLCHGIDNVSELIRIYAVISILVEHCPTSSDTAKVR